MCTNWGVFLESRFKFGIQSEIFLNFQQAPEEDVNTGYHTWSSKALLTARMIEM